MSKQKFQLLVILLLSSFLILAIRADNETHYLIFSNHHPKYVVSPSVQSSSPYHQAKLTTAKILSNSQLIGSGVIIDSLGKTYQVITNAHVLQESQPPYQIQTFDGITHDSRVVNLTMFAQNDLALLQFESSSCYLVSRLGSSANLKKEEKVFTSGFPFFLQLQSINSYQDKTNLKGESSRNLNSEFFFTSGKILLFLEKHLEGGYQIGYDGDFEKGMSGGPLLNQKGELVGINGRHPVLWEIADTYEDGSQPSPNLQTIINNSSWAIPVEKIIEAYSIRNQSLN